MYISNISVSRYDVFKTCPQKYKYQYHLKVPSPEPEPDYFHYGTVIHKIAEEYVRAKGTRKIDDVCSDVLERRICLEEGTNGPVFANPLPFEYKMRLPEHLSSIRKITEKIGFEGELEYEFKYDLDPPNGKYVLGYIDRLFKKDDIWCIIDYKTTKKGGWRKTDETITYDLQLRCYARVVQKLFNVPADKIRAALYYLEGGSLVGAKFSQTALDNVEKTLLEAYNRIVNADPDKVVGNVGSHCNRCNFKTLCPFYRGKDV